MKISVFSKNSSIMGIPVMEAFIESVKDEELSLNDMDADVAVIWSVLWNGRMAGNKQVWDHYRKQNKPVIVLEVGVFDRGNTFRVGINGVNRDASFCNMYSPTDRIETLGLSVKPWRKSGTDIILCGQHEKSEQWDGLPNMPEFTMNTILELRKYTERRIVVRPHPRYKFKISDAFFDKYNSTIRNPVYTDGRDNFDFKKQLESAWAVVCYSSNPAIEAVIEGVPSFVSEHSFCYELGNHISNLSTIEHPKYSDRLQWLANMAYTEWTLEEIRQGLPWQKLKPGLDVLLNLRTY